MFLDSGDVVFGRKMLMADLCWRVLQSPKTGPELFTEVLGTLAAACDAMPTSSSSGSSNGVGDSDSGGSSIDQFLPAEEVVTLLQACLDPGNDVFWDTSDGSIWLLRKGPTSLVCVGRQHPAAWRSM